MSTPEVAAVETVVTATPTKLETTPAAPATPETSRTEAELRLAEPATPPLSALLEKLEDEPMDADDEALLLA